MNTERIAEIVEKKTGRKASAVESVKNNSVKKGIAVQTDNGGVMEVFYPEHISYETDEEIAEAIASEFKSSKKPEINAEKITERNYVLENVLPHIVGTERNEKFLEKFVTVQFLNLAVAFRVMCSKDGSMMYLVQKDMMKDLGISVEELHQRAVENLQKRDDVEITKLVEAIPELAGEDLGNMPPVYVLTSKFKMYGANYILRNDVLKNMADKLQDDLYILPSSVHELIILPVSMGATEDELLEMVTDTNLCAVEDMDKLSDSVYKYSRSEDSVIEAL